VAQKSKPQILKIYISQGIDAVKVCWYIYFFLQNVPVKKIQSVNIWRGYEQQLVDYLFEATLV